MLIHIQVIISAVISYHPPSFCVFETLGAFLLLGGNFFLSGERSQHKNAEGGTILREEGKRSREHGEHVFSLVFPEHVPETLWGLGKPIAGSRTLLGNEPLISSKMCFTKTEFENWRTSCVTA